MLARTRSRDLSSTLIIHSASAIHMIINNKRRILVAVCFLFVLISAMARADTAPTLSSWSLGDRVLDTRSQRSATDVDEPLMDPLRIPWYHPHLSRNLAEAELQKAEEGVYLMRPRIDHLDKSLKGFAIDVRATHTVKHFQIQLKPGGLWSFGQETFSDIPSFLEHFDNRPLLGDDAGRLMVLKYPYPRDVEENPDYHSAVITHFISCPHRDKVSPGMRRRSLSASEATPPSPHRLSSSTDSGGTDSIPTIHSFSLASKDGYLVKMGAKVKSWKRRWFVLKDRQLAYYTKETDTRPIRVIDLREVTSISIPDCESGERANLFKLILPWRTFSLQAQNAEVRKDWVDMLNWRLSEIRRLPDPSKQKHCPHAAPRSQSNASSSSLVSP